MNENKLPTIRPATIDDVRPMNIYDVVPPEGRAGIERARTAAAMNRLTRKLDTISQRMQDHIAAMEELKRERRRRGR